MAIYTTYEDVVKKMSSGRSDKVRFPVNALMRFNTGREVTPHRTEPATNLIFSHKNFLISEEYVGALTIKILFTSATEYNVLYGGDKDAGRFALIGSSTISTEYTTPDSFFTFEAGCFSGLIQAGDVVLLTIDSHLSKEMVEDYIEETEAIIDGMLTGGSLGYEIKGMVDRVFDGTINLVPDLVQVCCLNLTCYYIYTDIFYDKEGEREGNNEGIYKRWKNKADKSIQLYIKAAKSNVHPKVYAFPPKINRVGVAGMPMGIPTMQEVTSDPSKQQQDSREYVVFGSEDVF